MNKQFGFILLALILVQGCGNPSQRELSRIFEETESLAIFSVPDCCEPHFYASSEFSWRSMVEGMSESGGNTVADFYNVDLEDPVHNFFFPIETVFFFIRLPVDILLGTSKSFEMPPIMKSHFRYILCNAIEGRNPNDQVTQIIYIKLKEQNPELDSQRVHWSDRECTEYRIASPPDKKIKMKELYRTLDSYGIQMLLKIQIIDYGLAGATRENWSPHFFIDVQAELIHCKDGKRIYRQEVEYKSVSYDLKEWGSEDSRILKEEFDKACQNIGDMISDELFESKMS